jgi:two-component system, OmpR family, KDP operon response regulator KdpE
MNAHCVLIVEDEAQMRRLLRTALCANGYRVVEAESAAEARALAPSHNPDLVLLDLGLPDGSGVDVTRELRRWSSAPILVLSARGREQDKVEALDAGADDYVTKPFGMAELLARVRVALRRSTQPEDRASLELDIGPLHIDLKSHLVTRDGEEVHLTRTEFRVLALLARHVGRVLTHRQILKEVWGPNAVEHPHYVRVQMAELRKKLERDPARPQWLVTEQGVGYRLRAEAPASRNSQKDSHTRDDDEGEPGG